MPDLFEAQHVPMTHGISVAYNSLAGNQVIELALNNPNVIRQTYGLQGVKGCANGLLRELRCYASIGSIPEVPLPEIFGEDSDSDRIMKTQAYQWLSSRFELVVFTKNKNGSEWIECGVEALKNSNGSRYRLHRILDLVTDDVGALIPEWGRIGVAVRSVGYGYPQSWDRITFTGAWVQEFTWCQPKPPAVIVNNYGTSASPSPTPTPTPPPEPTFTLSLAEGKTSAVANGGDSIVLTITSLAAGVGVSGVWLKNDVATTVTESISTTASNIHLLPANKLVNSGAGNYKLRLTYGGKEYTTNAIAVTLSPQVSLAISATQSGDLSFFVVDGQTYEFAIQGSNFTSGSGTYTWFRGDNPATVSPSPGVNNQITGNVSIDSNGNFSLNKTSSGATFTSAYDSSNKEGLYKLRITKDGINTFSNTIYGANKASSIGFSPTSVSMAGTTPVTVTISGFAVGQTLTTVWLRNNVELPGTAQQHTYAENGGNSFNGYWYQFSVPAANFANSPYGGAGTYKLKVSRPNTPINFTSTGSVTITA